MFKVDAERQLIFIKGSIPGRRGGIVYLRDSLKNANKNDELLNFPTFIPRPGAILARSISVAAPDEDPESRELHENDVIKGEEED